MGNARAFSASPWRLHRMPPGSNRLCGAIDQLLIVAMGEEPIDEVFFRAYIRP
jgi:hypothetical protein